MLSKFFTCITVAFVALTHQAIAQQWLSMLPQKPDEERTFGEIQQAFEAYYRQHPVNLQRDKLKPTFKFQGVAEERDKKEVEEYKLFKRWEWFNEPRSYPTGRLDLEKITRIKATIASTDAELIRKQPPENLQGLAVKADTSIFICPITIGWHPLGPSDAVGGTNLGRVDCIEFDPANSKTIYVGAPDGGVWKSTDFGGTWSPKFDFQPTLSVGDLAIDRTNPNIVYAATSDAFGYGIPFWGGTYSMGVMKSINGGSSWIATGLSWTVAQNRTIRRLVIHPTNGKILMAATSNGLYRTVDAGATWTQIWATSTYDVEFQQNDGNTVYATTSQVLKSTNAGASFVPLTASCAGARYNIEIARSNPKVLYTLCTNGTVQKSTDMGTTWSTVTPPGVTLYGYYDNVLAVSPVDDKVVYVAGFNMRRSIDGGTSWSTVATAGHVDNHCIEFMPGSGSTILCGNDGGLFRTTTGGTSWTSLNKGLSITQFYRVGLSRSNANLMVAGAQDNGNMKMNGGVFTNITNADGMDDFIDWSNNNNIYCGIQNGNFYRSTNGGVSFTGVNTPSAGAWLSPWCQHPTAPNTLFAATNKVYKSTNQGTTWVAISASLAGIATFTVLKVSQSNPNIIYAGNGTKLYTTTNGGTTWSDITAGLPVGANFLMDVAINENNTKIAYVSFSGYNAGQKVFKTINGGSAWTNISGTLPNMPVNCIAYEKNIKNALYIGTDAGVYYINDGLTDWIPYKCDLPNVIIDDLEIHYESKKITAATYGRGLWQAPLKSL